MVNITKAYVTKNSRYKAAEIINPQGIVLHSIGCPQPKASVLQGSWANNSSQYVTHYVLDDTTIYQCMPDNYKCWHIGTPGNNKWIGVEMCEPKQIKYTSGAKFTCTNLSAAQDYVRKTYANAVQLFAHICKKYGWNPQTAIYTHNYITTNKLSKTDHVDPEHLWNGLGLPYTLDGFKNDVAKAMGSTPKVEVTESKPSASNSTEMYRVRKSWSDVGSQIGAFTNLDNAKQLVNKNPNYYVFDSSGKLVYPVQEKRVKITASLLNVRKSADMNSKVVTTVPKNMVYTIVEEQDGWGLLKSYQKKRDGWINLKYTIAV